MAYSAVFIDNEKENRISSIVLTLINACFTNIPDSGTLDHVPYCETLDGLVLSYTARAVGASHKRNVAAAFLVATAISSFLCLEHAKLNEYTLDPTLTSTSPDVHPTQIHRKSVLFQQQPEDTSDLNDFSSR